MSSFKSWTPKEVADHNMRVAAGKFLSAAAEVHGIRGAPPPYSPASVVVTTKPRARRASKSVEERLNKTEKRWLEVLRGRGYVNVGIQDVTFRLANDCRYTPDFSIGQIFGTERITFFEVKGAYIWEDSTIKLKMAASKWPQFRFVRAQWKGGKWTETEIRP